MKPKILIFLSLLLITLKPATADTRSRGGPAAAVQARDNPLLTFCSSIDGSAQTCLNHLSSDDISWWSNLDPSSGADFTDWIAQHQQATASAYQNLVALGSQIPDGPGRVAYTQCLGVLGNSERLVHDFAVSTRCLRTLGSISAPPQLITRIQGEIEKFRYNHIASGTPITLCQSRLDVGACRDSALTPAAFIAAEQRALTEARTNANSGSGGAARNARHPRSHTASGAGSRSGSDHRPTRGAAAGAIDGAEPQAHPEARTGTNLVEGTGTAPVATTTTNTTQPNNPQTPNTANTNATSTINRPGSPVGQANQTPQAQAGPWRQGSNANPNQTGVTTSADFQGSQTTNIGEGSLNWGFLSGNVPLVNCPSFIVHGSSGCGQNQDGTGAATTANQAAATASTLRDRLMPPASVETLRQAAVEFYIQDQIKNIENRARNPVTGAKYRRWLERLSDSQTLRRDRSLWERVTGGQGDTCSQFQVSNLASNSLRSVAPQRERALAGGANLTTEQSSHMQELARASTMLRQIDAESALLGQNFVGPPVETHDLLSRFQHAAEQPIGVGLIPCVGLISKSINALRPTRYANQDTAQCSTSATGEATPRNAARAEATTQVCTGSHSATSARIEDPISDELARALTPATTSCLHSCSGGSYSERLMYCWSDYQRNPDGSFVTDPQGFPVNSPRTMGLLRNHASTARQSCRMGEQLLLANAMRRATLLSRYPELERDINGTQLYKSFSSANPTSEQNLELLTGQSTGAPTRNAYNASAADEAEFRAFARSLGQACDDPRSTADRVFHNEGLLQEFLSCNGTASPVVDLNSQASMSQGDRACQMRRQNAQVICQLRQQSYNRARQEERNAQSQAMQDALIESGMNAVFTGMEVAGCAGALQSFTHIFNSSVEGYVGALARNAATATQGSRTAAIARGLAAGAEAGAQATVSEVGGSIAGLGTRSGGGIFALFTGVGAYQAHRGTTQAQEAFGHALTDCVTQHTHCEDIGTLRNQVREAHEHGVGTVLLSAVLGMLVPGGSEHATPAALLEHPALLNKFRAIETAENALNHAIQAEGAATHSSPQALARARAQRASARAALDRANREFTSTFGNRLDQYNRTLGIQDPQPGIVYGADGQAIRTANGQPLHLSDLGPEGARALFNRLRHEHDVLNQITQNHPQATPEQRRQALSAHNEAMNREMRNLAETRGVDPQQVSPHDLAPQAHARARAAAQQALAAVSEGPATNVAGAAPSGPRPEPVAPLRPEAPAAPGAPAAPQVAAAHHVEAASTGFLRLGHMINSGVRSLSHILRGDRFIDEHFRNMNDGEAVTELQRLREMGDAAHNVATMSDAELTAHLNQTHGTSDFGSLPPERLSLARREAQNIARIIDQRLSRLGNASGRQLRTGLSAAEHELAPHARAMQPTLEAFRNRSAQRIATAERSAAAPLVNMVRHLNLTADGSAGSMAPETLRAVTDDYAARIATAVERRARELYPHDEAAQRRHIDEETQRLRREICSGPCAEVCHLAGTEIPFKNANRVRYACTSATTHRH